MSHVDGIKKKLCTSSLNLFGLASKQTFANKAWQAIKFIAYSQDSLS